MKEIKGICNNCGTPLEYTKKELIFKRILNIVITTLVIFGILLIIYAYSVGLTNMRDDFLNSRFERISSEYSEELRLISMNVTQPCDGDYSFCYAQKIYDYIGNIRYVPFNKYSSEFAYNPMYVLEHGGNCRDVSNLYVAMLKSVGVEARMNCNVDEKHCIAVVPEYRYGEFLENKLVVDLTYPYATILKKEQDDWEYLK